MSDQVNRTFICSVVFIDLVGYSKKPVTEQIRLKTSLTNNLSEAIKDIPVNDRIILDTGDGAALSFLGDPEDALFTTLSLREAMVRDGMTATQVEASGEDSVRMGINLGPVKLVKDINGHPNIIGDGINVAQRIMSFARPGQIVVSRSYYDVVSNLASEYAKLFTYEGSRTDKHVREHEIYVVGHHEGAMKKARDGMKDRAATTTTNVKRVAPTFPAGTQTVTLTVPSFVQDRRKLTMIAGALGSVVVVLGILVAVKRSESVPAMDTAPVRVSGPVGAPPAHRESAPESGTEANAEAGAEGKAEPKPAGEPASGDGARNPPKADTPKPQEAKPAAAAAPGTGAKAESGKAEAPPVAPATVAFSVQPWGEVFVNGKSRGVYPPLKPIQLPPGKYRIEIRNTTFTPLVVNLDLKSRQEITVRHKFD